MSKINVGLRALQRMAGSGLIGADEAMNFLRGLRMTNKDAAVLARMAFTGAGDEAQEAAKVLRLVNEGALGMRPISNFDVVAQPRPSEALSTGVAKRVAKQGAKNVAAFDRAVPDAVIGDVDWYGLGALDADQVGRTLFPSGSAGLQRDVGAGIIAKLSPKTPWVTNKARARKAAEAYNSGEMDTFLSFVDNNKLWGKSLDTIRAAARDAGLPEWKHITGMDTYQVRDIHRMITNRSGLVGLKTGDLAKKIDDFYGALRLPDTDRAALKVIGLMDPETERILDPSAQYLGQTLGDVPTGTVVDKIQEGLMLGYPQIGYKGFDLPLLDDPRTYRLQSDALRDEALRAGKTQLRFQSDPWAKRHYLYPDVGTAETVVSAGGARGAEGLAANMDMAMRARRLAERGLFIPGAAQ